VRHVRDVLALRLFPLAAAGRGHCRDPRGGAAGDSGASAHHRADPRLAGDQSAARDRRPAVLPAELRHAAVRHRFPQHRPAAADPGIRGHEHQLRAPDRVRGRGAGSGRALSVPLPDLSRDRDPRHRPGPGHHRPDGGRPAPHLSDHVCDRWGARRACRLPLGAAIRRASVHRPVVRPDHLHDLRAGRARQHARGVRGRVHHERDHLDRRLLFFPGDRRSAGVRGVHRADLPATAGNLRPSMKTRAPLPVAAVLAILVALPWLSPPSYFLHIVILILIWGFIYTAWSMMGKFGLTSLGHGAFLGAGAYTTGLLWNFAGLTPWVGMPIGVAIAVLLAVVIGYPCFRLKVVGHYFALVTLALAEVARRTIVAARDITGGSLGMTPHGVATPSWFAVQFADKRYFYFLALALWLFGLWVWRRVENSMASAALEAISEDEGAAA